MQTLSNEELWTKFETEFPSEKTLRRIAGPEWIAKSYTLFYIFLANMISYVYGPAIFGSDVGIAEAHEDATVRRSYNPIRIWLGYPYVIPYVRVFRRSGYDLSKMREQLRDMTIYDAVGRLRWAERDCTESKVPFIIDGAFISRMSPKKNQILAREFLSFVQDNMWEMETRSWRLLVEGQNAFLVSRPEYLVEKERRRTERASFYHKNNFNLSKGEIDLPLDELGS